MFRKILFPILLGLAGCAVLISLGLWQVDRLAWKEAILTEIATRMDTPATPLPDAPAETADEYRTVALSGVPTGQELHVLTSGTAAGTGYRVISQFQTDDGRMILLDQGLLPFEAKSAMPATMTMEVTGTLLWPDDQNSSTPDPDLAKNIWFARNVVTMSAELGTEPIMVVARVTDPADPRLTPLPVTTSGIKNDHLEYAITWFLLAVVWAAMTLFLIFRVTRPKES